MITCFPTVTEYSEIIQIDFSKGKILIKDLSVFILKKDMNFQEIVLTLFRTGSSRSNEHSEKKIF